MIHKFRYWIIGIIIVFSSNNLNWTSERWKLIVNSDALGYYAYLPAIFIYNDLQFEFVEDNLGFNKAGKHNGFRLKLEGGFVNKYSIGTAILQSPFFLTAHLLTIILNGEPNGYSFWYAVFINIAAIFYFLAGLYFMEKCLSFFSIRKQLTALILLAITLGTNAFYYAVVEPGMSHIYSFCLINIFVYYNLLLSKQINNQTLIWVFLVFGAILLVRPVNFLIVFSLPFIYGNSSKLLSFCTLVLRSSSLYVGLVGFLVLISIQPIIYYLQTTSFFQYSYGNEGFNFSEFHFMDFLFSYKKGFFLYTPLALLACFGLPKMYKYDKDRVKNLTGFLIFLVYILSSWWNWWYGGSFSSRVMLDYLIFFVIPLGFLLEHLAKSNRQWVLGLITICCIVCQIQIYQYRYYYIHWENTDKAMYWENFLRIDKIFKHGRNPKF